MDEGQVDNFRERGLEDHLLRFFDGENGQKVIEVVFGSNEPHLIIDNFQDIDLKLRKLLIGH